MQQTNKYHKEPLISTRFIKRLSVAIGGLLLTTIAIYTAGRLYGHQLALGGHSDDQTIYNVLIDGQHLSIKANMIRFDEQRRNGPTRGISLYVSWPDFEGYTPQTQAYFNQSGPDSRLIFINIAQATGQADMSARYIPIYRNFMTEHAQKGPGQLLKYDMDSQSSFKGEQLYVEHIIKEAPFVILCLKNDDNAIPKAANCQRDIHLQNGLMVTYRYSENLLDKWQEIEQLLLQFIEDMSQ